jgi:acetoin utilization deacetylase AcuC-like enzyme
MIFISAGFDAHREDDMGQMGWSKRTTPGSPTASMDVARRHAKGRMVSCLEGRLHLDALARCVEAHIRVLADV